MLKLMFQKVNGFTLPALMLNAGIETETLDENTFQTDVFVSPLETLFGIECFLVLGV